MVIYMKFKHFDDVQPNDQTNIIMAYFAINRALSRLEYRLRQSYKGHIPYFVLKELLKIRQNLIKLWLYGRININPYEQI